MEYVLLNISRMHLNQDEESEYQSFITLRLGRGRRREKYTRCTVPVPQNTAGSVAIRTT
jgi:hypothetical protein